MRTVAAMSGIGRAGFPSITYFRLFSSPAVSAFAL